MKIYLKYILSIFVVCLSFKGIHAQSYGSFQAKATLDSTVMIMGSKSALHVEFTGPIPENTKILTDETTWDKVELEQNDTREKVNKLGNGRTQITREYMIQTFDSGIYTLPSFYIIVAEAETIRTNTPVLKVDPISLDTSMVVVQNGQTILKINESNIDVVDENYEFWDFLPDWVTNYWIFIVIVVVVLSLLAFVYFKWLRHGKIPLMPHKKPIPPYQLAIEQLRDLQSRQLWQQGAEKEYYTKLTDILRTYLGGRFGINAMEMTTDQLMSVISTDMLSEEDLDILHKILNQADFVKFAKARPLAPENEQSFNMALRFVENTKPKEETQESSEAPDTSANVDSSSNVKE